MKRSGIVSSILLILLALAAGFWLRKAQPPESPLDRAHRICRDCGLSGEEVGQLIDDIGHAQLKRDEKLNLFRAQFEDPSDTEPCANAILDAAPASTRPPPL